MYKTKALISEGRGKRQKMASSSTSVLSMKQGDEKITICTAALFLKPINVTELLLLLGIFRADARFAFEFFNQVGVKLRLLIASNEAPREY